MSQPTITFITRTYGGRPAMFARLVESLKAQTCQDYEHLVLELPHAPPEEAYTTSNGALSEAEPSGRYMFTLDDDDMLEDPRLVETVAGYLPRRHPWLMVKCHLGSEGERHNGIWPRPWGPEWRPRFGDVSSLNLVVSREAFMSCRHAIAGHRGGDFRLATELWKQGYRPTFVDILAARTQMIGDGRAEADLSGSGGPGDDQGLAQPRVSGASPRPQRAARREPGARGKHPHRPDGRL